VLWALPANYVDIVGLSFINRVDNIAVDVDEYNMVARFDKEGTNEASANISGAEVQSFRFRRR
jgi:hypothetical protein